MIPKPFDLIDAESIQNLVTEGRAERRTLEYKQDLPNLGLGQDKYEFLFDVASFANASGGDILFGVVDKRDADNKPTGIPESAPGVSVGNPDAVIRQLEQSVRANIDPKVPGFQMRAIPGFPNGPVVVARVPKSFLTGLHFVKNEKNWVRFYSRGSTGKHLLDATEIRSAFALSESLPERVRRFRDERLARLVADETPVRLGPGPRTVLHILPIGALNPTTQVGIGSLAHKPLPPLAVLGWTKRFNFDGLLFYEQATSTSYVQVFRSGAVEAVEVGTLRAGKRGKLFPISRWEKELIDKVREYLNAQRDLGLSPPLFVMLSLLGVRDYYIPHSVFGDTPAPIDRDVLLLPDLLVEDYAVNPRALLMPAFDALWQSAGWPSCKNVNQQGEWEDCSKDLN
jgi:hypothetical protein